MARGGSKPSGARVPSSKSSADDKIYDQNSGLSSSSISKDLQQKCLSIFQSACRTGSGDIPVLQKVKGHLYDRDFAAAFGNEEYLRVYASRWSPSRALAYLHIFDHLAKDLVPTNTAVESDVTNPSFNVVCLGGGAGGELVALAGWLNNRLNGSSPRSFERLKVTLVDIADWTDVVNALHNSITNPPELSKYASQTKRDANRALLEGDSISIEFKQLDILDLDNGSNLPDLVNGADLVTFMFTLNELYSTSMSKTQHLLSTTLDLMRTGSHLLVVDSPGSYSSVTISGAERKYPMQWLLNYTLLGNPRERVNGAKAKWKSLLTDDSRWFRLPQGLQYPIEIENMRYQIHLYRRLSDSGD